MTFKKVQSCSEGEINVDDSQSGRKEEKRGPPKSSIDLQHDPTASIYSISDGQVESGPSADLSHGEGFDVVEVLCSHQLQHQLKLQHLLDSHFYQVKAVLEQLKASAPSSIPNVKPCGASDSKVLTSGSATWQEILPQQASAASIHPVQDPCSQPPAASSQPPALGPQPPVSSSQPTCPPGMIDEVAAPQVDQVSDIPPRPISRNSNVSSASRGPQHAHFEVPTPQVASSDEISDINPSPTKRNSNMSAASKGPKVMLRQSTNSNSNSNITGSEKYKKHARLTSDSHTANITSSAEFNDMKRATKIHSNMTTSITTSMKASKSSQDRSTNFSKGINQSTEESDREHFNDMKRATQFQGLQPMLTPMTTTDSTSSKRSFFPKCECCVSLQEGVRNLLQKKRFSSTVACLIVVNAIVIGVQTDWAIQHVSEPLPTEFRIMDIIFTVFFTIELSLRLLAEQANFLSRSNDNFQWNILDSFIVGSALAEELIGLNASPQAARLLRILRLVRVVRVIRVMRFFHDLRIMVYGIMCALSSLMWCIGLLLLIMFAFATCMMQLVVTAIEDPDTRDNFDAESAMEHFGSMTASLYTMHKAIFGGIDWGDATDYAFASYPALVLMFMVYITFAMLCVLNVVTGVFVENANKITMNDEETMITEELTARQVWFEEVRNIFVKADADGSGSVEWDEFVTMCEDVKVNALMKKMGVDVSSSGVAGLFQLLDFDGDGTVDIDEFVLGIQQIHGTARSVDIVKLTHLSKNLIKKVDHLIDICSSNAEEYYTDICS